MTNEVPSLRPLAGRILVAVDPEKDRVGTIWIPKEFIQDAYSAEVLKVGPTKTTRKGNLLPTEVEPGQRILIRKWEGVELPYPWEGLMMVRFEHVIAILAEGVHAEYVRYTERESDDLEYDPEDPMQAGGEYEEFPDA